MSEPTMLAPSAAILMKVGFHGAESIQEIIDRKLEEEATNGFCMWGYGGSLCHPKTQVRPFAEGRKVTFVGIPTTSPFESGGERASEYSLDGVEWQPLARHDVFASKFALCLKNLRVVDATIDSDAYEVAIGPSKGRPINSYMQFRCDKACAERKDILNSASSVELRPVALVADLVTPFSLMLR